MKRKRIIADYERRTGEDGKDTYIYTGPKFSLDLTPGGRRRMLAACWLVPLVSLAIFVGMGLLNADSSRKLYVALPHMSLFLPAAMLIGDAYKLTVAKPNMQRAEYERGFLQMRRCTIAALVLSVILLVIQFIYILFGDSTTPRAEWVFALGTLTESALFCIFLYYQKHIQTIIHR